MPLASTTYCQRTGTYIQSNSSKGAYAWQTTGNDKLEFCPQHPTVVRMDHLPQVWLDN